MKERIIVEAMHRLEVVRRMRIQTMLRGTDAHRGQGPILNYLQKHPKCTQSEIAEALGVSAPSITCSVKRMENAGLIVKTIDANDLRCSRIELTPKGLANHIRVGELFNQLDTQMLSGISEEEQDTLIRLYEKMIENLYKDGIRRPLPELMSELRRMEDDEKI